jgi:hypothetical protein
MRAHEWIPAAIALGAIGAREQPQSLTAGRHAPQDAALHDTAKQKLSNIFCAMASAGFDHLWIDHSPRTCSDVAKMIWSWRGMPATPLIRVPGCNRERRTEGD